MPGLLRIRGTIDTAQFWPDGSSDADTVKLLVTVDETSFAFAANGKTFKTTRVFFGARSRGKTAKPVIDSKSRITVRLQGIDAPELHYKATPLPRSAKVTAKIREAYNAANKERRQHWAESATLALSKKLGRLAGTALRCEFVSFVETPNDVVDTYGRFVGNIRVGKRYATDINLWLTAQGYVYPAFYSSMSQDEIESLLAAAVKGRRKGRVWKDYARNAAKFEEKLLYRPSGDPVPEAQDRGPVLMPKLYRRQVSYRVSKKAKAFKGTFADFVRDANYECFRTDEFLIHGVHAAQTFGLEQFLKGNQFLLGPADLVFKEDPAVLIGADGKVADRF